ncbi:fumarylacetoacetate hydrolase family protein [Parapusillimonas sp. SGNA-6]|nr:fumarylacetoacetate hydrolase family protein [Parapusillimonas sp. SGNA-6]
MKLATLCYRDETFVAVIDGNNATARPLCIEGRRVSDMLAFIEHASTSCNEWSEGDAIALADATILAPIPRPRRNVICVGKNYYEHAHEFAKSGYDSSASSATDAVPKAPIIFTKMPESVVGPDMQIGYPGGQCEQLDYEAELGVIIGKAGQGIAPDNAMEHVFGYVIINDLTARDLQATHKQWFLGKSFETSCPMGPWIATADDINGSALQVQCWVNGELRQDANTRDLIFDIPNLIATLSKGMTLLPGDIIATGTPVGVGIGFSPPRFLLSGDEVEIAITGLGRLRNTIR